MLQPTSFIVL